MKRIVLLLFFIFLIGVAFAESNKVYIVVFKYEDGRLTFGDKLIKYGYSPDRKLMAGEYKGEIVSVNYDVLYSFNFDIPLTEFVDISNLTTGEISGGMVRLDKTRFALVLPYFEKAKKIEVYAPDNIKILSEDIEEKKGFNYYLLIALFVIVLLIILMLAFRKNKSVR